jgi:hypothetical protein
MASLSVSASRRIQAARPAGASGVWDAAGRGQGALGSWPQLPGSCSVWLSGARFNLMPKRRDARLKPEELLTQPPPPAHMAPPRSPLKGEGAATWQLLRLAQRHLPQPQQLDV